MLPASIVALRKESVDRNKILGAISATKRTSLSARRAWIETCIFLSFFLPKWVALRKESVDRNVGAA